MVLKAMRIKSRTSLRILTLSLLVLTLYSGAYAVMLLVDEKRADNMLGGKSDTAFDQQAFLEEFSQLDFMVWEQERANLRRRLVVSLSDYLNHQPINAEAWYWLLMLYHDDPSANQQELAWVFERARRLSMWDVNRRARIGSICVSRYSELQGVLLDQCRGLLESLEEVGNLSILARKMGLSTRQLRAFLVDHEFKLALKGL